MPACNASPSNVTPIAFDDDSAKSAFDDQASGNHRAAGIELVRPMARFAEERQLRLSNELDDRAGVVRTFQRRERCPKAVV